MLFCVGEFIGEAASFGHDVISLQRSRSAIEYIAEFLTLTES